MTISEDELGGEVADLKHPNRFRIDEQRPQNVEERLEDHPDQLGSGPREQLGLQLGGDVDVQQFVTLVLVMFRVVLLEGNRVRYSHHEIPRRCPESGSSLGAGARTRYCARSRGWQAPCCG